MTEEQRQAVVDQIIPEIFALCRRMGEDLAPNATLGECMAITTDAAVRFLAVALSVSGGTNVALEEVALRVAKINEAQAARAMN